MSFNADKCKMLHTGYRNEKESYMLNGTQLQSFGREVNIGVIMSSSVKPSQLCSETVKKANKINALIGKSF